MGLMAVCGALAPVGLAAIVRWGGHDRWLPAGRLGGVTFGGRLALGASALFTLPNFLGAVIDIAGRRPS